MKKLSTAIFIVSVLIAGYNQYNAGNKYKLTDVALANVEALANDDDAATKSGRYRTVGCNGTSFKNWAQYCCPNERYHNCPATHTNPTCTTIEGCD